MKQVNPNNLDFDLLAQFIGHLYDDHIYYDQVAGLPSVHSNKYQGGVAAGVSAEALVNVRAAVAHDSVILEALGWPCKVVKDLGYLPYIETDVPM